MAPRASIGSTRPVRAFALSLEICEKTGQRRGWSGVGVGGGCGWLWLLWPLRCYCGCVLACPAACLLCLLACSLAGVLACLPAWLLDWIGLDWIGLHDLLFVWIGCFVARLVGGTISVVNKKSSDCFAQSTQEVSVFFCSSPSCQGFSLFWVGFGVITRQKQSLPSGQ